MSRLERALTTARHLVFGLPLADRVAHTGHAMAGLLGAMGAGPALTEYDRHREAYARTGDPAELQRMLRHVRP